MNTESPLTKKRKLATVVAPPEDVVNEIQRTHSVSSGFSEDGTNDDTLPSTWVNGASYKVINDPVHGHIELHPLCIKIIDTPQFQRLRNIKQLGGCYFVFPGASHNRFEHSLGVAYLATKLCKRLRKTQPYLGITDQELLCIQIAGLCHDLGHGPFSHLFDGIFLTKARPGTLWKHEIGSGDMLEHLIKENNLMGEFEKWKLFEKDIHFIKDLILGEQREDTSKPYLFEIVSNKRTGIDVDKWDYFARDCYHLGISNNFDYKRYMKFARVVRADGQLQICTREKEVGALYDMFHTRNSLHRRAYQHKTAKIIDTMIVDALLKADPFIGLPGKDGRIVKISEAIDDMYAYTHLTDNILHQIELTRDPRLAESQNILRRIQTRDLYSLVGQAILRKKTDNPQVELCAEILNSLEPTEKANFHIQVIEFDYGMKDLNPIDGVRFYGKDDLKEASRLRKDQVSQMLPEKFAEQHLRLYCRFKIPELINKGKSVFKSWCRATGNSPTKDEGVYPELTPSKQSVSSSLASSSSTDSGKSRRRLNHSPDSVMDC